MQLTKTDIDTFRRCIMREIKFRKNVYPKWVQAEKMKQEQSDIEIQTMEKIKEYLLLSHSTSFLLLSTQDKTHPYTHKKLHCDSAPANAPVHAPPHSLRPRAVPA